MPRIVLDTNVIVSALIGDSRGPSARIWKRILWKKDSLVISDAIIAEVEEVLEALGAAPEKRNAHVGRLRKIALAVKTSHQKNFIPSDPEDDKIIEAAIAGKADFVVSGDKRHLLPLGEVEGIRIASPADYLKEVEK